MTPQQIPARDGDGHLYAARFSDGTMKLGATINPRQRYQQLKRCGRIEWFVCGALCGHGLFRHERLLLARANRIACVFRGREWFHGLLPGEAVNLIKQSQRLSAIEQARKAAA